MNSKLWTAAIAASLTLNMGKIYGQNVNIESFKDILKAKPLVLNGGVSANNAFASANDNRPESYNYCFQANANANLFGQVNLPFSVSLTNAGSGYNYPIPPNRFSLRPSYKWISAQMGQSVMTFSPYTLNGHPFTGGGVELTPDGPWKISAMTGLLQKAVAYDAKNPKNQPYYERMGYGGKVDYDKNGFKFGISSFYAKDNAASLTYKPDSLNVFPQQNLAVCYTLHLKPLNGLELSIDYGQSALTLNDRDTLAVSAKGNYLKALMGSSAPAAFYQAIKLNTSYTFHKTTLGLGYEHVDPDYRTLGAFFFNNDFENMTLNIAQNLFKNKVSMSANVGLQYDNLNAKKESTTKRMVGSINLNCTPSEKLQLSGSYSNFQTHMLMQSQFQEINQTTILNLDSLNFIQISQNATLNANLITKSNEQKNQTLAINVSFQDASDEKGGIVQRGSGSQLYNLSTGYTMLYPKRALSINMLYNASYNATANNRALTHGPTFSANSQWLNKKLNTGLSTSYNNSTQSNVQIFNIRLNTSYTLMKQHRLNMSLVNQLKSRENKPSTSSFTGTLGYNYSF